MKKEKQDKATVDTIKGTIKGTTDHTGWDHRIRGERGGDEQHQMLGAGQEDED